MYRELLIRSSLYSEDRMKCYLSLHTVFYGLLITSLWYHQIFSTDVKVWDIVAELVRVCTIPAPPNPFAIDFDYYESLPVPEKLLSSGAMVNFLRRLLQGEQHSYTKRGKCFSNCCYR